MKRFALLVAAVLAILLVAFATIPLAHKAAPALPEVLHERRAAQLTGSGELRAGAARVELAAPSHGPIAGYPLWRRDDGSGEPIFVRALVLEQGDLHEVVLSLPLLMIPGPLEEEIVLRAHLSIDSCLLAGATHTHAGPGGTWNNLLVAIGGNGLFTQSRADAVAQAAADAIALARTRLAPARVAAGLEPWVSGPSVPRSGSVDNALAAVRLLDADNRALASLVVYGMHATVIPRSQHGLNGDWPEAAAQALENASGGAPALILQGAEGNATYARTSLPADPNEAAQQLGLRVATEAGRVISAAAIADSSAPLACSTELVVLPDPRAGLDVSPPLRRAAGNLLRIFSERTAVLSTLQLPGLLLQGIPAEPVGELGPAQRHAHGGRSMLVGLADGYAGYVETRARWLEGEGESARTWYGPELSSALGLEPVQ